AIVAGGDARDALGGALIDDRLEAGAHGLCDCLGGKAVDDDLPNGDRVGAEIRLYAPTQRRAERVVGRGDGALVLGADLGAGANDAAGERRDDVVNVGDGIDGGLGGLQEAGAVIAQNDQVAATDRVGHDTGRLLDDELAI